MHVRFRDGFFSLKSFVLCFVCPTFLYTVIIDDKSTSIYCLFVLLYGRIIVANINSNYDATV